MKERFYLYVFYTDINGKHELVKGKLFFSLNEAEDEAHYFLNFPGHHVQIVACDGKNTIVFEA